MIRTNFDRASGAPQPAANSAGRPTLSAGPDGNLFSEWMAHIDAGRIAVR
jgi:hypothetical protein